MLTDRQRYCAYRYRSAARLTDPEWRQILAGLDHASTTDRDWDQPSFDALMLTLETTYARRLDSGQSYQTPKIQNLNYWRGRVTGGALRRQRHRIQRLWSTLAALLDSDPESSLTYLLGVIRHATNRDTDLDDLSICEASAVISALQDAISRAQNSISSQPAAAELVTDEKPPF